MIDSQILPFEDNYFDFTVAESCLDSMPYRLAKNYISEIKRATKKYIYASLIAFDPEIHSTDEYLVTTKSEQGTIQSVFDDKKVEDLFGIKLESFTFLRQVKQIDPIKDVVIGNRYYIVVSVENYKLR